jgi:hypothetical protein
LPTVADREKTTGWWPLLPLLTLIVVAVIVMIAAFGGFYILSSLPTWLQSNSQTIVVLLVAGLVSVTLLLYLGTIILRTAGLSSKKEALGMPEGSIRALIAMSLILMFAIIGVTVLYSGMGGEPIQSNGISQAELERLENVQIIAISVVDPAASPGAERFNVTARPELSPAGHDFGLQLLTTVSTLVVAVAGFYFGSRAVAQGAKTAAAAQTAAAETAAATAVGAAAGTVAGAAAVETPPSGELVDETMVAPLAEDELVGAVEEVSDDEGVMSDDEGVAADDLAADDVAVELDLGGEGEGDTVVNGGTTEDDLPGGGTTGSGRRSSKRQGKPPAP